MKSQQGGFTLIEVMISLVLAAIAIMGIMALYLTETKASGFSRHTTEAAVLVQDKIEKLRTQGAGTVIPLTTETQIDATGKLGVGGIFTRSYTETAGVNFFNITVTVTWSDDGVPHSIAMQARRNP